MRSILPYRQVYLADFEFSAPAGERPAPICCVCRELWSRQLTRLWLADDTHPAAVPYSVGPDCLFVAYYASAELGCHLALNWPMPARVLDLFIEFRRKTSGLTAPCGYSLLGALAAHGLDGLAAADKQEMRELAMRGGPYTSAEREALLDYCQSDVDALARLLPAMLPSIDLPRALLRGRYMVAAARMEWAGVPIDTEALARLREHWDTIKHQLIVAVDRDYGVFVPAGQRTLNPESTYGEAVLREAGEWDLDPHHLAAVVDEVWTEERQSTRDSFAARRAARQATGLTHREIDRWENEGRDYTEWPGLDVAARELAGRFPALGIGRGYTSEEGYDNTDYAGRLWDVLRERDESPRPRHHPDILRRSAELATARLPVDTFGPLTFSTKRWADYLIRHSLPWPQLASGALALDDDTFREMARAYPAQVGPIRELRHALSQLRLNELAVGSDGRNRVLLSAFASRTSRNQPSNSRYIFGPSTWLRSLVRPEPGRAIAYCDWSAQELAIAAALSGDPIMQDAYESGDPYLFLARQASAVPAEATKKSHPTEREQFKVVSLGVLYGLSADGLARKLCVPPCRGRELLRMHQETFRRFWEWSDRIEMQAMLAGSLHTVFGWTVRVGPDANPRSLRNFPMQANGAEMLRLACCLATERGINVCAPVHDALLVEGPIGGIEDVVARTQAAMREASEVVLDGFTLRTDAKIVRHPERYIDDRGRQMWETVQALFEQLGGSANPLHRCRGVGETTPCTAAGGPPAPVHPPPILISL